LYIYRGCCLYALCRYKEAYSEAEKGPKNDELGNRLRFHCAFKLRIGVAVIDYHSKLTKSIPDQLCLAAWQYLKGEYEEAIQIYKKIYMDKKYDALNIYLSMCYYKLEFYEIALELVNFYLANYKNSVIAQNLKAAIEYNSNGNYKMAQGIITSLQESNTVGNVVENDDLLKHNMTVFDFDEATNKGKLKVFKSLIDIVPEAKLNLIIYYLKNDSVTQAYDLIKDLLPNNTKEYILKAIVHCLLGQQSEKNQEHLKKAQIYFQTIGASTNECDTIEGRQCMASCFRLNGLYNDEIIYLESVETFMRTDDDFNWNYGIALAASQKYVKAEEVLMRIKSEKYKVSFYF
jgi:intraflagellar transport protein 56